MGACRIGAAQLLRGATPRELHDLGARCELHQRRVRDLLLRLDDRQPKLGHRPRDEQDHGAW